MKIIFLFFALIFALTIFIGETYGSVPSGIEDKDKTPILLDNEQEEYKQIFLDFLLADKWLNFNGATKFLAIDRYEGFVKKYPKSSLVDEAKLRIAEFYSIIRETWKAKKWLDDIIKNHPHSDMEELVASREIRDGETVYSGVELFSGREKTAAWALYYRVIWFSKNKESKINDLKRIIHDYPQSLKVIDLIKMALFEEWITIFREK